MFHVSLDTYSHLTCLQDRIWQSPNDNCVQKTNFNSISDIFVSMPYSKHVMPIDLSCLQICKSLNLVSPENFGNVGDFTQGPWNGTKKPLFWRINPHLSSF